MGLARAENLIDATQNVDVLVEVSGMIRALAANLFKISNDLRLLSSGPDAGLGELQLPPRQAGSSIMPGKVNPVIPEAVGQAALSIFALDSTLTHACALGNLELNQFLPLIADCLLTSLDLARNACRIFVQHCIDGLAANASTLRGACGNRHGHRDGAGRSTRLHHCPADCARGPGTAQIRSASRARAAVAEPRRHSIRPWHPTR